MLHVEDKGDAHHNAIDFFKSADGTISTLDPHHHFSHNPSAHHCPPTQLSRYSIAETLKRNVALQHKAAPFIDALATRFANNVLLSMPVGFNQMNLDKVEDWLSDQMKELDIDAPITPAQQAHPVKMALKLKTLSQRDVNNEVSFHHAGFICYKEEPCTPPFFNIKQQLWPYKRVSMDWITTKEAFFALAANILYTYANDQKTAADASPIKMPSFLVCAAFSEYFIEQMPYEGGHIPLQEIALWLKTNGLS